MHLSKLVIWGSSWGRGFRSHRLEVPSAGSGDHVAQPEEDQGILLLIPMLLLLIVVICLLLLLLIIIIIILIITIMIIKEIRNEVEAPRSSLPSQDSLRGSCANINIGATQTIIISMAPAQGRHAQIEKCKQLLQLAPEAPLEARRGEIQVVCCSLFICFCFLFTQKQFNGFRILDRSARGFEASGVRCMREYVYIYIYIYICIYVCICIYIYIYIHIHTHMGSQINRGRVRLTAKHALRRSAQPPPPPAIGRCHLLSPVRLRTRAGLYKQKSLSLSIYIYICVCTHISLSLYIYTHTLSIHTYTYQYIYTHIT